MTDQIKNYGLDLEREEAEQSSEDWVFGAGSKPCIAQIAEDDRDEYLPKGEVQKGAEDTMDCATRAPINLIEAKLTYLYQNRLTKHAEWLDKNGYVVDSRVVISDAFIAIKSGTTRVGNSLKAPLQAMHKYGLIPRPMLPLRETMTWDDYHKPSRITKDMERLGMEFLKRFSINYDKVYPMDFDKVYEEDMLDAGGFAWPKPENGEYPRSERQFNHAFLLVRRPTHTIFDSYIDSVDGDFIKKLAADYKLISYAYRLILGEHSMRKKGNALSKWLRKLLAAINNAIY